MLCFLAAYPCAEMWKQWVLTLRFRRMRASHSTPIATLMQRGTYTLSMSDAPDPPSSSAPQTFVAKQWYVRWALRLLAVVALTLGIAGVFIPGLPTTVFILIAGWAATRSSPRLHLWLWRHKLFGAMLRNWAEGGFVSRKAKYSAAVTMLLCAMLLWIVPTPNWVRWLACSCMAVVIVWLWRRPEPR